MAAIRAAPPKSFVKSQGFTEQTGTTFPGRKGR